MVSREECVSTWSKVVYLKRPNEEEGQSIVASGVEVFSRCPVTICFWTGREDATDRISE